MRRHVVDGAEILRRTPEMPILAPVVASSTISASTAAATRSP